MALIIDELRVLRPHLIALQEVRQIPGQLHNQAQTIATALGMECYYETAMPNVAAGGDEGLAILSTFPIVERIHQKLPSAHPDELRILLGAIVQSPLALVACFNTHLNYRRQEGHIRAHQLSVVDRVVAKTPSSLPKILMGDFNATPDADEIRWLRGLCDAPHADANNTNSRRVFYQDAFSASHPSEPGHTWSSENPYTHKLRWLGLDRRLDYIFVTPEKGNGSGRIHSCDIVLHQADETGTFPSDHFGLMAEVQMTPNV